MTAWSDHVRAYRVRHPEKTYRQAVRDAKPSYQRSCNKTNVKKKIKDMSQAQLQRVCNAIEGLNHVAPPPRPAPPRPPARVEEKYIMMKKKKTAIPVKSRQEKPKLPSHTPPKKPPTVYQEKALERRLDKIFDTIIKPIGGYFATNSWTYEKNVKKLLDKWVPKIIEREEKTGNISKEYKKKMRRRIAGYFKVTKRDNIPKTSKSDYDELMQKLRDNYA